VVSLFIHLLILYFVFIHTPHTKPKSIADDKPINLNLSHFKPSPKKTVLSKNAVPKNKTVAKKSVVAKTIPKPKTTKPKVVKKKPTPTQAPIKKPTPKPKPIVKKVVPKASPPKVSKKQPPKKTVTARAPSKAVQATPMINRLYGSEFKSYTPKQQKFIKRNLETIHAITQRVLVMNGYPQEALDLFQEGVNVVSFYLHPNGSISRLKITQSSNSYFLDENTRRVIEMAYSQYPLPKQKTKIIFYVNYRIQ